MGASHSVPLHGVSSWGEISQWWSFVLGLCIYIKTDKPGICALACMINVCILVSLILFDNTSRCNFNIHIQPLCPFANLALVATCKLCYIKLFIYINERGECHCTCWTTSVVQPIRHWSLEDQWSNSLWNPEHQPKLLWSSLAHDQCFLPFPWKCAYNFL